MNWYVITILFAIGGIISTALHIARRKRLEPILGRPCAGRQWRKGFPDASKSDLREFLQVFADCFMFRRKHKLKFHPTDRIMDIYKALTYCTVDSMELEHLSTELEDRYRLNLETCWHESMTLGELFSRTRSR